MNACQKQKENRGVRFVDKSIICCEKGDDPSANTGLKCLEAPKEEDNKICISTDNSRPLICPKIEKVGYDRIWLFRPLKWRCKETLQEKIKVPQYKEPSLGQILGVSFSTVNISYLKPDEKCEELLPYAACLIAFGEWFITPEEEWECQILNHILEEGLKLLQDSMSEDTELTESAVNRKFVLCRNTMVVEVSDPFLLGRVVSEDMQIQNLHWGILKFFKKFQHGVLLIGKNNYYLIWSNFGAYFLFDSFGRCSETLTRMNDGYASIICFKSIDNLSHLLLNLSDTKAEDMFTLRNIQMVTLLPCCVKVDWKEKERTNQWEILNNQHAILKGHLHISSTHFKELRFKSTLTISLTALLYAKIDLPAIWNSLMVDEIILLGVKYFRMWSQCDLTDKFGIQDIPCRFEIGQYTVEIIITPMKECGIWTCLPNYRQSQLTAAIKSCFNVGSYLIVQIERRSYPLFRKNSYFYFLDAYKHTCSSDKRKLKVAAVHMLKSLDTLCCVFTQSILEVPTQRPFYIHVLSVLQIKETSNTEHALDIPCSCVARTVTPPTDDAVSLNESIIDIHCKKDIEYLVEHDLIEEDIVDLDSPGLSDTQLNANYLDFKNDVFGDDMDDDEGHDASDDLSDADESEADDDSDECEKEDEACLSRRPLDRKKKSKDDGDKKSKKGKDKKEKKSKKEKKPKKEKKEKEKKEKKDKKGKKGKKGKKDGDSDSDSEEDGDKDKLGEDDGDLDGEKKGNEEDGSGDTDKVGKDGKGKDGKDGKDKDGEDGKDKDGQDNDNKDGKGSDLAGKLGEDGKGGKKKIKEEGEDDKTDEEEIEEEEDDEEARKKDQKGACNSNNYPGYSSVPHNLAVVGSESGTYESLCKLLRKALNCTDRALVMTAWGNYVVFKLGKYVLVYSGCTCNVNRFRHLDLRVGTAGLICFKSLHDAIQFLLDGNAKSSANRKKMENIVEDICNQYCCD